MRQVSHLGWYGDSPDTGIDEEVASGLGLIKVQGYGVAEGGPVSNVVPGLESLGHF